MRDQSVYAYLRYSGVDWNPSLSVLINNVLNDGEEAKQPRKVNVWCCEILYTVIQPPSMCLTLQSKHILISFCIKQSNLFTVCLFFFQRHCFAFNGLMQTRWFFVTLNYWNGCEWMGKIVWKHGSHYRRCFKVRPHKNVRLRPFGQHSRL